MQKPIIKLDPVRLRPVCAARLSTKTSTDKLTSQRRRNVWDYSKRTKDYDLVIKSANSAILALNKQRN